MLEHLIVEKPEMLTVELASAFNFGLAFFCFKFIMLNNPYKDDVKQDLLAAWENNTKGTFQAEMKGFVGKHPNQMVLDIASTHQAVFDEIFEDVKEMLIQALN